MELSYHLKPRSEKVTEATRAPLERRPVQVRGHVTGHGEVVEPYQASRNVRVDDAKYKKFSDMSAGEQKGVDYDTHSVYKGPNAYGVFGIHGGKISEVVAHLTDRIAGERHSKYLFSASKESGNSDLVIKGHQYDDPEALELAHKVPVVVSLAISSNKDKTVLVDGRNEFLADEITNSLREHGFSVKKPFSSHLNGMKKSNIANQGREGVGVQIQLPKDLRNDMTDELRGENPDREGTLLSKFTKAVGSVLERVDPNRSVAETEDLGARDGRARTKNLFIGEFSELKADKKTGDCPIHHRNQRIARCFT